MRLRGDGRWRPLVGAGLVACLAVTGCTLDPEVPQGLTDPVAAGEGPCGLLTIEEIEVALNRRLTSEARRKQGVDTLADTAPPPAETQIPDGSAPGGDGEPGRASAPAAGGLRPILPGMRMCALGPGGRAGVAWGALAHRPADDRPDEDSNPEDGAEDDSAEGDGSAEDDAAEEAFRRYRDWHAPYVEPVAVDGGEATWDEALRTLVVFADDRVVGVRLPAPDPDTDEDQEDEGDAPAEEPDDAMRDRALDLALRALRRL